MIEGETGSVEYKDFGKCGFVPTIQDGSNIVAVEIFDLGQPSRRLLGRVEAVIGGDAVRSDTDPWFVVRVRKVAMQ